MVIYVSSLSIFIDASLIKIETKTTQIENEIENELRNN